MRQARLVFSLLALITTVGLGDAGATEKLLPSREGLKQYTLTDEQERSLRADVTYDLADPESARFRNIRSAITADGMIVSCGELNAKNRMGGYTGYALFVAGLQKTDRKWHYILSDNKSASVMLARCVADGLAEATR